MYSNPPPTPNQILHNIEKDKNFYANTSEIREKNHLWGHNFQSPPSKKISFANDTNIYVDMDKLKSEKIEQRVQKKVNGKTATVVRMENGSAIPGGTTWKRRLSFIMSAWDRLSPTTTRNSKLMQGPSDVEDTQTTQL